MNKYHEKVTMKEKLLLSSKNLAKEIELLKDEIEKQQANDKLKNATSGIRGIFERMFEPVTNIINNSDNINYQLLYQIVSDIYQLNICCYDNNNKVLFTTGKSKQLELLIDDDIVANIYSG